MTKVLVEFNTRKEMQESRNTDSKANLCWYAVVWGSLIREYVQVYALCWFLWSMMECVSVNSQLLAIWKEERLSPPLSRYNLRIGCRHEHQSVSVNRWAASVPKTGGLACLDSIHKINANMKGSHSVKRHRITIVSLLFFIFYKFSVTLK